MAVAVQDLPTHRSCQTRRANHLLRLLSVDLPFRLLRFLPVSLARFRANDVETRSFIQGKIFRYDADLDPRGRETDAGLSLPHHLMRILGPIVLSQALLMMTRNGARRRDIMSELGNSPPRMTTSKPSSMMGELSCRALHAEGRFPPQTRCASNCPAACAARRRNRAAGLA
jgi:hypothetical protein